MTTAIARIREGSDEGMTLVELLVYSVLLVVVMTMSTTLFINVITTQQEITVMAEENNEAQQTFSELERDVRNAGWVDVRWGGDLVVMHTRIASDSGATETMCTAYYYDEEDSSLRYTRSKSADLTGPILAASSATAARTLARGWPGERTDVESIGSARVFGSGAGSDGRLDAPASVQFSMRANASDDKKSIVFHKTVALRPQSGMAGGCE